MIPIPERHQVSAMPVGGGERVTGYYISNVDGTFVLGDFDVYGGFGVSIETLEFYRIDPTTIEPVRVKPIEMHSQYKCSNCGERVYGWDNYCSSCGLAIDWDDWDKK